MTNFPEKIANLSPEKQELLRRLIAQKTQTNQIIRHKGATSYPASSVQTRFLFLEQLQSGSSIYNNTKILKFNQYLNINALEKALEQLIFRHETLRTKFIFENQELKQVIFSEFTVKLPLINLTNYPEENRQEILDNLLTQETEKPFNLDKDLMFRSVLFKKNENEYILLLVYHHIISDNWSANILTNELLNIYNHLAHNVPLNLPELPIQYGDYTIWQKEQFNQQNFQKQLEYWTTKLAGKLPILNLPTDKLRPITPSYQGKSISFLLPENLTNDLKKISIQEEVTLFMLFLTAFKILLYRYTGAEDIIIGTPIFGRQRLETENLIGCFLNTLALRDNLGNNPTFKELLQQVKKTCLEAYNNQDLPFEKIIEQLQPERNLSNSPVFQVMFNFPKFSENFLPDCQSFIEIIKPKIETAMFDLSLNLRENSAGLEITFNYTSDLFCPETIQRMIGYFQTLLTGLVNNPNEKISLLPLLNPAEKQQILINWNNTKSDYPKDKCIHQLFEEQVVKTPHNIALVFEDQQLTYQELNEKANQLAHYLQKLGGKTGDLIGIKVERSPSLIMAMLAILKIGGAYLPLDINYPQERLNFMLEDAQVNLVITESNLAKNSSDTDKKFIYLDTEKESIKQESEANLETEVSAKNLAYVIYTSGSTGIPKGVEIPHIGVNRLVCYTNYLKINSSDKIAQISNTSFDAATFEIWGALLNGAQCIIIKDNLPIAENLKHIITTNKISIAWLTTGLFNTIIDQDSQALSGLKTLLVGGEALSIKHIKKADQNLPETEIINGYGPTENTTFTCTYKIPRKLNSYLSSIPIGSPISNTQIYILDNNLQPQPIGITGEIYVGGDGLAQGYLNREELTIEKFIPNPFGDGKLYKTGDLGRYLPDGNIEFIGRIDNQVKIRGFRIELGEIETTLNQHPNIKKSVVIAKENAQGDKYLVAYLITKEEISVKEIRQFLSGKLPDYLTPATFVFLDSFPLTPNGKIDRKSLPEPDFTANLEHEYIAPNSELETKLVQIWSQILGRENIGIRDNFFDLGGNSLLTIRLVYEIQKQLGYQIPVKTLFQLSCIETLAESLTNSNHDQIETSLKQLFGEDDPNYPSLTVNEKLGLLASTTTKKRVNNSLLMLEKTGQPQLYKPLFFVYLLGELGANLPDYLPLYHLTAWVKVEKPDTFIKSLATYYVQQILKIQPQGPYFIGGYCFGGLIALEIAQQLQNQGQEVALLTLIQTRGTNVLYARYQPLLKKLGYNLYLKLVMNLRILAHLNQEEKKEYLINKFQKIVNKINKKNNEQTPENNTRLKVNNEQQDKEILSSLLEARKYYQIQSYSGKVALFFAKEGGMYSFIFPQGGWEQLLTGAVSIHLVPGNHTGVLNTPNVQILAQFLDTELAKCFS